MIFDTTPGGRSANSYVSVAHYEAYLATRGGADPLAVSQDENLDLYAEPPSTGKIIIASSRAAVHGGIEGDWYYKSLSGAWALASDSLEAQTSGVSALAQRFLIQATRLIEGLRLCGGPPADRSYTYTGAISADSASRKFTAPAADNAFGPLEAGDILTVSGFANTEIDGDYTVTNIDVSADPHEASVSGSIAGTETGADIMLFFYYEQALQAPRTGMVRIDGRPYPDMTIPRELKDAVSEYALRLMSEDLQAAFDPSSAGTLRRVEIDKAVEIEYAEPSAYTGDIDKRHVPDSVLAILRPLLCEKIRGYGRGAADAPAAGLVSGVFE